MRRVCCLAMLANVKVRTTGVSRLQRRFALTIVGAPQCSASLNAPRSWWYRSRSGSSTTAGSELEVQVRRPYTGGPCRHAACASLVTESWSVWRLCGENVSSTFEGLEQPGRTLPSRRVPRESYTLARVVSSCASTSFRCSATNPVASRQDRRARLLFACYVEMTEALR